MYSIIWTLLYVVNGHATSATLTSVDMYDTKMICQQYITAHQAHVADYARGFFNLDFDTDMQVSGECKPPERGA